MNEPEVNESEAEDVLDGVPVAALTSILIPPFRAALVNVETGEVVDEIQRDFDSASMARQKATRRKPWLSGMGAGVRMRPDLNIVVRDGVGKVALRLMCAEVHTYHVPHLTALGLQLGDPIVASPVELRWLPVSEDAAVKIARAWRERGLSLPIRSEPG